MAQSNLTKTAIITSDLSDSVMSHDIYVHVYDVSPYSHISLSIVARHVQPLSRRRAEAVIVPAVFMYLKGII